MAGTGSEGDELVLAHARAAATMELVLDDRLAVVDLFPAIDVDASGARHDEQLLGRDRAAKVAELRRSLGAAGDGTGVNRAGLEQLLERLRTSKTNAELLAEAPAR